MSIIYVLIPIAVLLTAIGIYLFFWAVKTEQFDDLEKQGMSILFDDEKTENDDNENVGFDQKTDEQANLKSSASIETSANTASLSDDQINTSNTTKQPENDA